MEQYQEPDEMGLNKLDQDAAHAPATDPPTREKRIAELRAKAAQIVDDDFDEEALLAQFVQEETDRRHAASRALFVSKDDQPVGREGTGVASAQGFPNKYVEVVIAQGRDKSDLAYVPLSVNGYAIKVTRGEPVIIPSVFVTEALGHAIEDVTIKSEGGLVTRPVHRFPFQVIRDVGEQEYLAFSARMRLEARSAVQRV